MKKNLCTIIAVISLQIIAVKSQTVSTFEDLTLPPFPLNSYWDGSAQPNGTTFNSGNAIFQNFYDSTYNYWLGGWAYSNMQDSTTAGYTNQFSAITATGNNSANYAIGQQGAIINLNANALGKVVNGFYVTTATYAALSMRDGDAFAKKFGGATGDDPDWFKLTVHSWYNGNLTDDSMEFYLADYRFSDNAQDYIVKNWQWVDLTSLGNADSLLFNLSSSDTSGGYMNTPAFFCMDDFTTSDNFLFAENVSEENFSLEIFPNPNNGKFNFKTEDGRWDMEDKKIEIYNMLGKIAYAKQLERSENPAQAGQTTNNEQLSTNLSSGIYFLQLRTNHFTVTKKIIIK